MPSTLFGLIDAARDARIYPMVKAAPDHACLFGGLIEPPLQQVAPYIVRATDDNSFFHAWREQGWGQSWGILARSSNSLADIRRHFRKFLQAQLPDGQLVLFRFYDPRVWRTYLPTCNPAELAGWFDGVEEYGAEGPDGGGLIRYRFDAGALQVSPQG